MTKKLLLGLSGALLLLVASASTNAQPSGNSTPPSLGLGANLSKFEIFTAAGAVSNTGMSNICGAVGTSAGAITGFENTGYNVNNTPDFTTVEGELTELAQNLASLPSTRNLDAVLGTNSGTIKPGVYDIPAAASIDGTLTLDAKNKINAIFVFRIDGAFTTTPKSKIVLKNGAVANNIFWVINGAVAIAPNTTMYGNIVGSAAIAMAAGATLEGRMLTTAGAIAIDDIMASYRPIMPMAPMHLMAPALGSLSTFEIFTAAGAISNTGKSTLCGLVGTDAGAVTGFETTGATIKTAGSTNAAADLLSLYAQLNELKPEYTATTFTGLTINPGVTAVPSASTIDGVLTLKGTNTSIFVIQVGGALTVANNSRIRLIGGVDTSNIFWVIDGAVTIGDNTTIAGNIISAGAISIGKTKNFTGRLLTTAGAVSINNVLSACGIFPAIPKTAVVVLKAPSLGTLPSFSFFTEAGAITNSGKSSIVDLVGTAAGDITGFTKKVKLANAAQIIDASEDLADLVDELNLIPVGNSLPSAILGNKQVINPGVYFLPAATSITGTLTLDGKGDKNSVFIFQIPGALTSTPNAKVNLINDATANNVFWQVGGTVALEANTAMYGNVIGSAAMAMSASDVLHGRFLCTAGAISLTGDAQYSTKNTNDFTLANIDLIKNNSSKLAIFPNPNHGKINLVFDGNAADIISTKVFDVNSQEVYSTQTFKTSFDLPTVKPGIYTLLLQLKTKVVTTQFIILNTAGGK